MTHWLHLSSTGPPNTATKWSPNQWWGR